MNLPTCPVNKHMFVNKCCDNRKKCPQNFIHTIMVAELVNRTVGYICFSNLNTAFLPLLHVDRWTCMCPPDCGKQNRQSHIVIATPSGRIVTAVCPIIVLRTAKGSIVTATSTRWWALSLCYGQQHAASSELHCHGHLVGALTLYVAALGRIIKTRGRINTASGQIATA